MADDDDRRLVVHEEILEPHHRFEIEVVRRFVEQQQVGLREEERGERNAHFPAAREAVERALLHLFVETEAEQNLRGAHRRGIGVDRDQALVDVAEPVGVFARLRFDHQRGALDVGGEDGVERRGGARGGFLRDIAEARALGHVGAAVIGLEHAGDDADERRLAGAVATDQADATAGRQRRGCAVEDRAAAEAHGDAVEVEHGRGP